MVSSLFMKEVDEALKNLRMNDFVFFTLDKLLAWKQINKFNLVDCRPFLSFKNSSPNF